MKKILCIICIVIIIILVAVGFLHYDYNNRLKTAVNKEPITSIHKEDEEEVAKNILYKAFGEKDEDTGNTFSYVYIGVYKDEKQNELHVFDVKWLVEDHLSSLGYYAVSIPNNTYYYVSNSPEFLDSGIVKVESIINGM